jgi:hypothetical protein
VLWGAALWLVFSICILIAYRELSTSVPLAEAVALPERLGEAVKRLGYRVEQLSATRFVGKPRYGLARLLSLEFTKLHVLVRDGHANLIGPASVVKRVRKKLLAS